MNKLIYDLFDEDVNGKNEFDFVYRGSILGSYTRLDGQTDTDLVCELMECVRDLAICTGSSSNYIYVKAV